MERTTGIPLWRGIHRTLSEEISSGLHAPGDRLPTEAQLAGRFCVNRHTLRRAMAALQEDGLVRVEQGRGTFVQEPVIDYPVSRRTRFSEVIIGADREPSSRILRTVVVPADVEAAGGLMLDEGEPLLLAETLHQADERPISVTAHQFPAWRFEGLLEAFRETGSITQALFRLGVRDYFRQSTRVTTRLPDAWEARWLQQARSHPVLVTQSVNIDPQGRPIEYAVGRHAGQRVQLAFHPK